MVETEVGYTGGDMPNATYRLVKTDQTGHAESLKLVYNPARVSF